MPEKISPERLAQAAFLYYINDLSQDQVAERLGTSRSNVSRMLRAARDQGIIKFEVNYPTRRDLATERILHAQLAPYGVREVVVPVGEGSDSNGTLSVGRAASKWLDDHLLDGMTVGMSWGRTIRALVDVAHFEHRHDVQVVQLAGEWSNVPRDSGHELVRDFALKVGGRHSYFSAPAFTQTAAEAAALLAEPQLSDALTRARSADVCILGIGSFRSGTSEIFLQQASASSQEIAEAEEAHVIGQLAGRFFDATGKQVDLGLHDRLVSLDLEQVRRAETLLVLAAGSDKTDAILGAARGGLIDVLVCDQALAQALCDTLAE